MIFRTITDDVTKANKSIGLFGKTWNDLKVTISNIKTDGFFNSIFNMSSIDKDAITSYNRAIIEARRNNASMADKQIIMTNAIAETNKETAQLIKNSHGLIVTNEALTKAQKASTLAAKAQAAAYKAASVVANMIAYTLIAKGIQFVSNAIDHYINRAKYAAEAMEEAQQKIDDSQNKLKEMSTALSENKDRFLELSQGIDKYSNNLRLSTEDYAEYLSISNQLAELFPSLVSGYDEQGNALLSIGTDANETNEKLQSLLETQQAVAQQTLIDNMDDIANGIYFEVEDARNSIRDMEAELSSLQQQYKDVNIDIVNSDGLISFSNENYSKYGKAMEDALTSSGIEFEKRDTAGLSNTAIQLVAASPKQLEQAQKFYDTWLETENNYYYASENGLKQDIKEKETAIKTSYAKMSANLQAWVKDNYSYQYLSDDAANVVDALIPEIKWDESEDPLLTAYDYQKYIEENILNPLMEIPQEHKQEIDNMFQKLLSFKDGDLDVLQFASKLQEKLNQFEIKLDITPIIAGEQEAKDKLQNSIEHITEGGSSDFTTSSGIRVDANEYKMLQDYAKDFNEEQIELWNKVTLGAENATDAITKYEKALVSSSKESISFIDALSGVQSLSQGLSHLSSIYADISDQGDFDWSSILNNDSFKATFGSIEDATGRYRTAYDDFIKTISNSPDNISACQNAFDSLASSYICNSDVLDGLTTETKDTTIAMLEQMGVANAADIVNAQLAAKQEAIKLGLDNLNLSRITAINTTYDNIAALVTEGEVCGITATALYQLVAEETIFSNTTLSTAQKISELEKLAKAFGITADSAVSAAKLQSMVSKSFTSTDGYNLSQEEIDAAVLSVTSSKLQKQIEAKFGNLSTNYAPVLPNTTSSANTGSANATSDVSKQTEETFDWLETKLDVLSKKTSALSEAFSNAYSIDEKNNAYLNYLSAIQEEIDANSTAMTYYQQKLNEIGLSYEWISRIQNGAFDISTITDPNLISQIQEYQSIYEKIQGFQNNIQSLEQQRQKAESDHAKDVVDTYEKEIEAFQKVVDKRKAIVELKETFGLSASNTDIKTEQDAVGRQINRLEEQNRGLYDLMKTTTYGSEAWQIYNDKLEDNRDSVSDLTQSLADLAAEMANLPLDKLDKYLEKNRKTSELYDAKIENATSAKKKNKLLEKQLSLTKKDNDKTQATAKETKEKLSNSIKEFKTAKNTDKKYVPSEQQSKIDVYYKKIQGYTKKKKQIPASLISQLAEEGHSNLAQAAANYNAALVANDTAQATAKLTAETTKTELANLTKTKFDNTQTEYERKQSAISNKANLWSSKMDLSQAKGYLDSEIWYNQLIAYENQNQSSLQSEANKLQKQLDEAMAAGNIQKYSDQWWEMTEAISSLNEEIEKSKVTLQEYKNQLDQMQFDNFDYKQTQLSRLTSESDFYIDLMSKKDLTDDNGLTEYGMATLGLHYQNYDTYLAQAKQYGDEIAKINEKLANDPYNTTLITQLQECEDAERDCILAAEDEKNAVIELKKQGYDALTTSLSDVIGKYKEYLRNAKDAYDYQNNIAEQSENINSLQKKIAAYSTMSGNEEIASKLQQANKELAEAQKNLEETMYEKYISDTESILDDLLDELEEFVNELYNNLSQEFAASRELAEQNAGTINSTLTELSSSYGISLSSAVQSIWGTNGYTPEKGFTDILTKMDALIAASNAQADKEADTLVYNEVKDSYDKNLSGYEKQLSAAKSNLNANVEKSNALQAQRQEAVNRKNALKEERNEAKKKYGVNSKQYKKANEKYLAASDNVLRIDSEIATVREEYRKLSDQWITAQNAYDRAVSSNHNVVQNFLSKIVNTEPTKSEDKMTELDKAVYQLTGGGYLTDYNVQQLADLLGTSTDETEILNTLKKLGFQFTRNLQPVSVIKPGGPLPSHESNSTHTQDDLIQSLPTMSQLIDISLPRYRDIAADRTAARGNVSISFGDLTLPDVTDSAEFAATVEQTLRTAICANGRTTKCLTEAIASQMTGRGVGKANIYR